MSRFKKFLRSSRWWYLTCLVWGAVFGVWLVTGIDCLWPEAEAKPNSSYYTLNAGEPTYQMLPGTFPIACCDCGLVHKTKIRVAAFTGEDEYLVEFRYWRDPAATAERRGMKRFACVMRSRGEK